MSFLFIRSPFRHFLRTEFLDGLVARSLESDGFPEPDAGDGPPSQFNDAANSQLIAAFEDF